MMKLRFKQALLLTLLLPMIEASKADHWSGNISGYLGQKQLNDEDWSPLEKQMSLGMILDVKRQSWPMSIAFDLIGSADIEENGANKQEAYTIEKHLGVRKTFEPAGMPVKPYIGGGLALINAKLKDRTSSTSTSVDDDAVGTWLGAGAYLPISSNFQLGIDVRYSQADVTLDQVEHEAGGLHWGATAGYSW